MKKILTPRADQRETTMRNAFNAALGKTPEHTKTTGRIFRALCTPAGLVRL